MTWSQAAVHWLVAAALALAFFATGGSREPKASHLQTPSTPAPVVAGGPAAAGTTDPRGDTGAPMAGVAAPAATPPRHSVDARDAEVELPEHADWIRLSRADVAVAWRRRPDGSWKVETPAGKPIPPGLLAAFAEQLDAVREGERVEAPGPDSDFGLDRPSLRVEWSGAEGRRGEMRVGGRTPTGTAWYARLGADRAVRIVGSNLDYYADLVFGAAR